MREIKFRAWNIITETMMDLRKMTPLALNMDTDGLFIPFSGMPLMQFTGLLDKNGKEIYEGDILESDISKKYAPVEWNNSTASFNCISEFIHIVPVNFKYAKIIGNIYENPELMEAK